MAKKKHEAAIMTERFLKASLSGITLGIMSLGLVACMTTSEPKIEKLADAEKSADIQSETAVALGDDQCPQIEILDGTGILTAYTGEGTETPENIAHQATIVHSGRRCSIIDGSLSLNIGAAGRAAKGPKSVGNSATLPIRIAVVRGENEVLFSQLYNQFVPFQGERPTEFSIKEDDIRLADAKVENIKILIGFDTIGSDETASAARQKTAG